MGEHRWERRTYTCAVCRTEAFDYAAPIGWLRVQRRIEADAYDTFKIVGFYCSLPCLAADVERWLTRLNAVTSGG
jgi:hypothetical protein